MWEGRKGKHPGQGVSWGESPSGLCLAVVTGLVGLGVDFEAQDLLSGDPSWGSHSHH